MQKEREEEREVDPEAHAAGGGDTASAKSFDLNAVDLQSESGRSFDPDNAGFCIDPGSEKSFDPDAAGAHAHSHVQFAGILTCAHSSARLIPPCPTPDPTNACRLSAIRDNGNG